MFFRYNEKLGWYGNDLLLIDNCKTLVKFLGNKISKKKKKEKNPQYEIYEIRIL